MDWQTAFDSIPFKEDGEFPDEIKCWCTKCDAPASVVNRQTNEMVELLTFEWVGDKKVFSFIDGQHWQEDLLRKHWKPFVCH